MMNEAAPPAGELFVTQFLVVSDQDRSRDFYQSVFGADVLRDRAPVILALANAASCSIPAAARPMTSRQSGLPSRRPGCLQRVPEPPGPGHRPGVPARGATFLTEPKDHGYEIRAYIRDPDGHLIEVGQTR
jgi:lactoylglutathione lyase